MFTGIVAGIGTVARVEAAASGDGRRIAVDLGEVGSSEAIGASIALSGVCCTLTGRSGSQGIFDLSAETLRRTWFDRLRPGDRVNLEPALRAGTPLGGHFVQGHVDATGQVVRSVGREGGEWWVRVPEEIRRYCPEKGSITIDGVSLTVAAIAGECVVVAIVPHTAMHTTIAELSAGTAVNLEADILAKHVERLLEARLPPRS